MASACQCRKARWVQCRSVTSRRYWLGSMSSPSTSAAGFGDLQPRQVRRVAGWCLHRGG
jgi:hypothetical protein